MHARLPVDQGILDLPDPAVAGLVVQVAVDRLTIPTRHSHSLTPNQNGALNLNRRQADETAIEDTKLAGRSGHEDAGTLADPVLRPIDDHFEPFENEHGVRVKQGAGTSEAQAGTEAGTPAQTQVLVLNLHGLAFK